MFEDEANCSQHRIDQFDVHHTLPLCVDATPLPHANLFPTSSNLLILGSGFMLLKTSSKNHYHLSCKSAYNCWSSFHWRWVSFFDVCCNSISASTPSCPLFVYLCDVIQFLIFGFLISSYMSRLSIIQTRNTPFMLCIDFYCSFDFDKNWWGENSHIFIHAFEIIPLLPTICSSL